MLAALLFLAAGALLPRPELAHSERIGALFAHPWLLSALSGPAGNLTADWIWLKSRHIDEWGRGDAAQAEEVHAALYSVALLDPYFTEPVIYGATYLASIHDRSDLALNLLQSAQMQNPSDFDLLMGEALLRVTYRVPASGDRLRELAGRIEALEEDQKRIGPIKMDDWLAEALIYVRTQEGQRQMVREDLIWLLERTTHPKRRAEIKAALEDLKVPLDPL